MDKRMTIAGALVVGLIAVCLVWASSRSPFRLHLVAQKVTNGKEVAVFRLEASSCRRVNLREVLVYHLLASGKPSGEQVAPVWLTEDPSGGYFTDHTELAVVAPTNSGGWGIKVEAIPEVSARLSFGMIKGAMRLRSLEPIKQSWNLYVLGRGHIIYSKPLTNRALAYQPIGHL